MERLLNTRDTVCAGPSSVGLFDGLHRMRQQPDFEDIMMCVQDIFIRIVPLCILVMVSSTDYCAVVRLVYSTFAWR